jgi:hypothetical protein
LVGTNKVNGPVPSRAGRRPASFTKFYRMLRSVSTSKMSAIFLISGVGGACMGSTGVGTSTGVLVVLTVGSNVGFIVSGASVGGTGIGRMFVGGIGIGGAFVGGNGIGGTFVGGYLLAGHWLEAEESVEPVHFLVSEPVELQASGQHQ